MVGQKVSAFLIASVLLVNPFILSVQRKGEKSRKCLQGRGSDSSETAGKFCVCGVVRGILRSEKGRFSNKNLKTPRDRSYSTFVNIPFSPHFSHFCGLQRPSLLKPHVHFHVAIGVTSFNSFLLECQNHNYLKTLDHR
jgi:hypothetical protein